MHIANTGRIFHLGPVHLIFEQFQVNLYHSHTRERNSESFCALRILDLLEDRLPWTNLRIDFEYSRAFHHSSLFVMEALLPSVRACPAQRGFNLEVALTYEKDPIFERIYTKFFSGKFKILS